MPAPRTCRACAATLSPDVRWCGLCSAPVTEFAARAPLHDGDVVSRPVGERGDHVPHWSRWEQSATTFGPVGRIVATILVLISLPLSLGFGLFLYALWFPVVAIALLSAIWAKGWVVPDEPQRPPLPLTLREIAPPKEPTTGPMIAFRITCWVVGIGATIAFAYGPVPVKAAVLAGTALIGPYWFLRGFLSR